MTKREHILKTWNASRQPEAIPSKTSFKPRELGTLLSYTYIIENRNEDLKFKLAGATLENIWGHSLTNQSLAIVKEKIDHYNLYHGLIKQAILHKTGLVLSYVLKDSCDSYIKGEEIILPYLCPQSNRIHMIGVQLFDNTNIVALPSRSILYMMTGLSIIASNDNFTLNTIPDSLKDSLYKKGITLDMRPVPYLQTATAS